MGCNQSTATDSVHDKAAGDAHIVSKQYGPPQPGGGPVSTGRGPMPPPGSSNGVPQGLPPTTIPPPIVEERGKIYIARFAYQARTAEDLSFEKGEKLRVRNNRGGS